MSDIDLKRFDIVSGQVQRVYEFDDGRWEQERIDADETWTLAGADVVHVERDDGWLETSIYRELDGSGTFRDVSAPDQPGSRLPDGADQGLARLYLAVFDRAPDQGGFRYWEQQLERGMQFKDVANSFINSAEFSQTYGALDNDGFVDQLYLNVLDRAADTGGKSWWVTQLENQTLSRQEVVTSFSESIEFAVLSAHQVDGFLQLVGQPTALDSALVI